jgi:hypothetical protein
MSQIDSKKPFGKRKLENREIGENEFSKQKKLVARSQSERNFEGIQIQSKISKTPITENLSNLFSKKPISLSQHSKQTQNKNKFTEGCLSSSLNVNIKKIIEQEKNLGDSLKKINILNEENKIKILNEFAKKNLELFEYEKLVLMWGQYKQKNEEKKIMKDENIAKFIANKESVFLNLEKTRQAITEITSKKLFLEGKITQRAEEIEYKDKQVLNINLIYCSFQN